VAALLGQILMGACGVRTQEPREWIFGRDDQAFSATARIMIEVLEAVGGDLGPELERRWKEIATDRGVGPFFLQIPLETRLDVLLDTFEGLELGGRAVSSQWKGEIRGNGIVVQESRPLTAFDKIKITGSGEVILTQGDRPGLMIEAERNLLPSIRSDVESGVLVLGFKASDMNIRPTKPILFHLSVEEISLIKIVGSADVIADGFEASEMELSILGSGDVRSNSVSADELYIHVLGSGEVEIESLDVGLMEAKITGSGDVRLEGRAASLQVAILGSGDYLGSELCAPGAKVVVFGSGDAQVCALDMLQVGSPGSGEVIHSGRPEVEIRGVGPQDVRRAK
jgi:hypothetical protein